MKYSLMYLLSPPSTGEQLVATHPMQLATETDCFYLYTQHIYTIGLTDQKWKDAHKNSQ